MAQAKKDLVIVESPAKARTIEKYLGGDYKVIASMGHLRDLPKSKLGVDIEHGFTPEYIPVAARSDVINELKKRSKEAGTVYLATDPDREGEAISWHLKELLKIPDEKARRVTFNEITKKVVQESIANPRDIDQDLVDAQQARRILDRIVGYKLSPLLWRKVRRGLSAGRVQSVAIRMVVDRENEIRAFQPEEYWYLDAHLDRAGKKGGFVARYYGTADKKKELHSEKEVEDVIAAVEKAAWEIGSVKRGERQRSPSPPFITSTLQQEASRRLGLIFGILPMPKKDTNQDQYYAYCGTGETVGFAIPYNCSDPEFSAYMVEAISCESKNYLTPAYMEVNLKSKDAKNDEDLEMLEIIFNNIKYDIGEVYDFGKINSVLYGMVQSGDSNIVSKLDSLKDSINSEIETLIDQYESRG